MIGSALGRRLGAILAASLVVAALASLAPPSPAVSPCAAAGPNHAAVVVEHGNGSLVTRCVGFAGSQITGKDLLDASGIAWSGQIFGSFGVAVCAVDAEPAHYSSCPGNDAYWALFVSRGGGAWQLTAIGVSSLTLADGDAEGLRYVPATGTPAAPPAPAGVCATEPAATPSGTATRPASPPPAASPPVATLPARTLPAASGSGAGTTATPAETAIDAAPTTAPAAASQLIAGADATAGALPSSLPGVAVPDGPGGPAGLDPGLLLAAVAGGALAGLALLRLLAGRRAGAGPPP